MAAIKTSFPSHSEHLLSLVWIGAVLYGVALSLQNAYRIRVQSIEEFGTVIHDLDPYFNWRATEYLYERGATKFFRWFDHMVWYPLGRPVGTTIYPGMQFTAVFLKNHIIGDKMSLNDICCYIPAWFGVVASFLVGCTAYEASLEGNSISFFRVVQDALTGQYTECIGETGKKSSGYYQLSRFLGLESPDIECAVFAMGFMAVVPAHLMRSVGGLYDNESVAMTAMSLTFLLWMRSLRNGETHSHIYGILTGVAYFYMVATWGGYIFVLNLIGAHAALLVLLGRFSNKVYLAYTLFYVIGTSLAIQVPVVGWSPLKSLEQLGPCVVFLGYQVLQYCEMMRKKNKWSRGQAWMFRIQLGVAALVVVVLFVMPVTPKGYFGPISSRVRALFVPHTKTGNPLVDSVGEHDATSHSMYWGYLHILCFLAPLGLVFTLFQFGDSASFLLVYAFAAYFFSRKMSRFLVLIAPIASALSGIAVGRLVVWSLSTFTDKNIAKDQKTEKKVHGNKKSKTTKKKKKKSSSDNFFPGIGAIQNGFKEASKSTEGKIVRGIVSIVILGSLYYQGITFKTYSWSISNAYGGLSVPLIVMNQKTVDGTVVRVDDYREACWWLRDNTAEDAKVMAWWDFGYQITSIANRTTIADGNTWNHEHIALLGKALTGSEEEGYQIARHLADYIFVRFGDGGAGDDLAKSPHYARIANSVYRDHCPGDVTCHAFGTDPDTRTPYPMMEKSLLYKLYFHQLIPGVQADPNKFQEVFRSEFGLVRIYKILRVSRRSKAWVEQNRECDAGGWFCPGKYPPGLKDILNNKKDFAQLEDFNRGAFDEEYQTEYFENLNNPDLAKKKAEMQRQTEDTTEVSTPKNMSDEEKKARIYSTLEDTDDTFRMWKIVTSNAVDDLNRWLKRRPEAAWIRSSDGRGPMWWAFESKNQDIVAILMEMGVPYTDKDKNGFSPADLLYQD